MKTREIINCINGNGGLDVNFIYWCARKEGVTVLQWTKAYIKSSFDCSDYVASKVAEYYFY